MIGNMRAARGGIRSSQTDAAAAQDNPTRDGRPKNETAVVRTAADVEVSTSTARVAILDRERRRLRVLARCLAATVVALLGRIVVSGFSVLAVTLVAMFGLLLIACVRLSLAMAAAGARSDAALRDRTEAGMDADGRLCPNTTS
jgi:hypothetical protein